MNKSKYIAEGFGTLFLVLMGCGSAVLAGGAVGNLGIAFAFGLTVLIMVYAIGPISGCHINPAITAAMLAAGKIDKKDALWYMAFQFFGAFLGAALLYCIATGNASYEAASGLGQNGFGALTGYGMCAAIIAEVIFTALFLFVIFGVTSRTDSAAFAGLAIGLALTVIHIVGIPVTGVSVNPARSFGPALMLGLTGSWTAFCQLWVFIVAPVIGGLLGFGMWKCVSCCKSQGK